MPPLLEFSHQIAPSVNFQMIGFEKDSVGDLLEQGAIDMALGVFADPPRQTQCEAIFEKRFVGIARQGHFQCICIIKVVFDTSVVELNHGTCPSQEVARPRV